MSLRENLTGEWVGENTSLLKRTEHQVVPISQTEGLKLKAQLQTRKLASLDVFPVGMGTARTFDVSAPKDVAVRRQVLDNCVLNGVAFLDTSPMYGNSERVIGETIGEKRGRFQLATKVWTSGLSRGEAQIARSFQLLKTRYIEVYQIHNLVDWRTHLPILERMKEEGRIGLIGITHYVPSAYPEMERIMRTGRIDTIQIPYNVQERRCEERILPLAADMGLGVIVMEPLDRGRLAKSLRRKPDLSPLTDYGISTWAQALLAWILTDPTISIVIPGTSRPERVAENAQVGKIPPLPGELRRFIEKEMLRCL